MTGRLQKTGLINLFNLDGSIFQWANGGGPFEPSPSPPNWFTPIRVDEQTFAGGNPGKRSSGNGVAMDSALQELNGWRSISSLTLLVILLAWESLAPFFAYFSGNTGERVRHGLKNVALGVLNALFTGLVFAALWWATAEWAQAHEFGVLS